MITRNVMQAVLKIDLNGGIWQSRISKYLAEYVQHCVCFVNVQSSLHKNVCLCAHVQCRVCYIYHVEFHFRFRRRVSFLVKHQLNTNARGRPLARFLAKIVIN